MDTVAEYSKWCATAVREYIARQLSEKYKEPEEEQQAEPEEEPEEERVTPPPGFYQEVYKTPRGGFRTKQVQIPHTPDVQIQSEQKSK